jgi:hypothetical protein
MTRATEPTPIPARWRRALCREVGVPITAEEERLDAAILQRQGGAEMTAPAEHPAEVVGS